MLCSHKAHAIAVNYVLSGRPAERWPSSLLGNLDEFLEIFTGFRNMLGITGSQLLAAAIMVISFCWASYAALPPYAQQSTAATYIYLAAG